MGKGGLDAIFFIAYVLQGDRDAYRIEASGKRAIFIGMENGYPVGNDLSLVEFFYNQGILDITLCHSSNNDICDSSTDPDGAEHNGLSTFGEQVIAEMNRLGIMVDVSHVSDDTVLDVLEFSPAPVIAPHSCARAVYAHPRNLSDRTVCDIEQVRNNSVLSSQFSKKTEILRKSACVLKLMSPIKDPCKDNIFIVGDAA